MATQVALSLLKQGLLMATDSYDLYLTQLLDASKALLIREGISSLDEGSVEDMQLIEGYAEFLYRQRFEENKAMPKWLRWAINNRVFSEKMQEASNA